jgi:hypothetical protein
MFQASVTVQLGDGSSACFWTDVWLPDSVIVSFAPNLFRAIDRRFHGRTVKDALFQRRWVRDIAGALTAPVVMIWEKLESIQLQPLSLALRMEVD